MGRPSGVALGNRYAREVVAGKVPGCRWVRLACQRHLDDQARQKDRKFPFRFDSEKGNRACRFIERLVHVKGEWAGQRIRLEPWQAFIIGSIFGWVRKRDGRRRFREAYLEIPRKNGKSVFGAGIGNYLFVADGEEGAEVYSGATTEKQAWEVFRPARLMAQKTPGLKDHFGITIGAKNLAVLPKGSRFEPVIGKPGDGSSPHCAIIDEFHEHKTSDLYDTMKTGMGARRQPLNLIITTAGTNLAGPCFAKHEEVQKVLKGTMKNDELFGILYGIDEKDDWKDFSSWIKANPNFGVSVYEDYLRAQHRDATQLPTKQNINRCKHLNQWLTVDTAWMNILAWNACREESLSSAQFQGQPVWAGLDLASKTDIAALILIFRREGKTPETPVYCLFGRYWLPEETIERPENQHYQTWKLMGRIVETPGAVIDYDMIEDDIKALGSNHEFRRIGYDPFQATQLSKHLTDEGFPMIEIKPTVLNFSEPMKELEKLVLSGRIKHDGDPVLTWMIGNVVAHLDKKDNIYPNKTRPENKIDGAVASIMALDQCLRDDNAAGPGIAIL